MDCNDNEAVRYISSKIRRKPSILIIYSSALGAVPDIIKDPVEMPFEDIPNFPVHSPHIPERGKLIYGEILDKAVLIMQGRFHYYEGFSLQETALPVKIAAQLGCKYLIVTNAAGSINPTYKLGDLMLIKDHVYLFGLSGNHRLRGGRNRSNDTFYSISHAYDKLMLAQAQSIAIEEGIDNCVHEGVYGMVGGPCFESTAETIALKCIGADAVGMSTIPEVMVAAHCEISVFGLSIITDRGIFDCRGEMEPSVEEVVEVVKKRKGIITKILISLVASTKMH